MSNSSSTAFVFPLQKLSQFQIAALEDYYSFAETILGWNEDQCEGGTWEIHVSPSKNVIFGYGELNPPSIFHFLVEIGADIRELWFDAPGFTLQSLEMFGRYQQIPNFASLSRPIELEFTPNSRRHKSNPKDSVNAPIDVSSFLHRELNSKLTGLKRWKYNWRIHQYKSSSGLKNPSLHFNLDFLRDLFQKYSIYLDLAHQIFNQMPESTLGEILFYFFHYSSPITYWREKAIQLKTILVQDSPLFADLLALGENLPEFAEWLTIQVKDLQDIIEFHPQFWLTYQTIYNQMGCMKDLTKINIQPEKNNN